MSQEETQLGRARGAIERVLGSGKRAPLDLALDRAEQWVRTTMPSQDSSRGGSSHPTAVEEAAEDAAVARLAAKALEDMPELCRALERAAFKLEDYVIKLASTIDPSKNPNYHPGCKSCLRTETRNGETIGGHWAPIREDVKSHELCDWCYRNWLADKQLPPVEVCHTFHTVSKTRAGAEMAKRRPPKEDELPPACASEYTHQGTTLRCIRAVGHDGEHASAVNGERVPWPNMVSAA